MLAAQARRGRADQDRRRRRHRVRAGLCGAGARLFRGRGRAGGAHLFRRRRAGRGGDGVGRRRFRRRRGDRRVLQPRRRGRAQDHRRRRARSAGLPAPGDRRLAPGLSTAASRSLKDLRRPHLRRHHQGAPPIYVVGGIVAAKYGFDFKSIDSPAAADRSPTSTRRSTGGKADFTAVSVTPGMLPLMRPRRHQAHRLGRRRGAVAVRHRLHRHQDRRRARTTRSSASCAPIARARAIITTRSPPPTASARTAPAADAMIEHPRQVHQAVDRRGEARHALCRCRGPARRGRHPAPGALYKSQGLVKHEVDGDAIIDKRYTPAWRCRLCAACPRRAKRASIVSMTRSGRRSDVAASSAERQACAERSRHRDIRRYRGTAGRG